MVTINYFFSWIKIYISWIKVYIFVNTNLHLSKTKQPTHQCFLKGFGDFHKKKRQICSENFSQKKSQKKTFSTSKFPDFHKKKTFWAPKSPFFAQNPGIFTKKNAGRFAAGFSPKKNTKQNGASRRFFTKKHYCFFL